MAETKINLSYQVDGTQFENKVGTAVGTGEATDEVDVRIVTKIDAHNHTGPSGQGPEIDYTNLANVPGTFTPTSHTHPFGELTSDISFVQLDSLVSTGTESNKIIAADDSRLSDTRDSNAHTHMFVDLTDDIIFTQLDSLVSTGIESSKIIAANDPRLSDVRTPITHNNTYHSEAYITTNSVTYDVLLGNGDVGPASTQVAQGDHNHNTIYYTQSILNDALAAKAAAAHQHSDGDVLVGGLGDGASYKNAQFRALSFSPFGFGDWYVQPDGTAMTTAAETGDHKYLIALQMLPNDAVITNFTCYVVSAVVHSLSIKLYATALDGSGAIEIASLSHTTATGVDTVTTDVISTGYETVDKVIYHYWVELDETGVITGDVEITGGVVVCAVEIPLP